MRAHRLRAAALFQSTRGRRVLFILATTLVLGVLFAVGKEPRGPTARLDSDAYYMYLPLASLATDGDLDFSNQYAAYGNWYGFGPTPAGRPGNVFGVGPAVFAAPLFAVGRLVAFAAGAGLRDGFSRPEIVATLFASVLASVFAMVFASRFIRRRLGPRASGDALALLTLLAGPVFYYAVRQPGYAHPFGSLFAAWLVDHWDESYEQEGPRRLATWLGLGALFGAVVLARPQLATWVVLPIAAAVDDARRVRSALEWRRLALGILGAALVATLVFAPQLLAWRVVYGSAFLIPQGQGFMRWREPAMSEALFSARNGLLAWAPFYAIGLAGLVLELRSRAGIVLATALLLQIFVNGAAWDWWGGGAFGGRRFCSTYVVFAFGAAALWRRLRPPGGFDIVSLRTQFALLPTAAIAAGNVALAWSYASSTVRIHGGEAPSAIMRERIGPRVGGVLAASSDAVMALPRAAFAIRHGASFSAYDAVVGVYLLDELFPGLNIREAPSRAELVFGHGRVPPYALGFAPAAEGLMLAASGAAHGDLLLSLNERRPRVRLELFASGPVDLLWRGRPLALTTDGRDGVATAEVSELARGVNVLTVRRRGEAAVTLHRLRLAALD